MPPTHRATLTEHVLRALSFVPGTNAAMAERIGTSARTIVRWRAREAVPSTTQLGTLARLVHGHDPALATQLATYAGESLQSLGLVTTRAPSAAAIDSIVCAAAETMDHSPRAVRGAVLAAFRRAAELDLDVRSIVVAMSARAAG